jgi:predicted urease superfamily metal-dependent hydrolase
MLDGLGAIGVPHRQQSLRVLRFFWEVVVV